MRLFPSLCVLALCAASCSSSSLPAPQGPPVAVRREPGLDGRIAEFPRAGRVTLVDFWSTSCDPCKRMMPSFESLWQEHRNDGLDIVGVATDDNPGLVAEQLKSLGITYPNLLDTTGQVRGQYRVGPVPHSVVIDKQGRVRLSIAGGKDDDLQRVQQGVREALREN